VLLIIYLPLSTDPIHSLGWVPAFETLLRHLRDYRRKGYPDMFRIVRYEDFAVHNGHTLCSKISKFVFEGDKLNYQQSLTEVCDQYFAPSKGVAQTQRRVLNVYGNYNFLIS
jgi:hypothetical protein